jgi:redox-sensitive bicupin YhaK (pirin superfamily)
MDPPRKLQTKDEKLMIELRKSSERGHQDHGWLNSYHTFSFADYYDPKHMGFRALRVINEDYVAAGEGFPTHPHRDMEIITYVLSGELAHKDSMGTGSVILPGDVQKMSAGSGVRHSEFNHSKTESVHLLQIWIMPDKDGIKPSYEQKNFPRAEKLNRLKLVASPDSREGSVSIQQDAELYVSILEKGKSLSYELSKGRFAWIQIARGEIEMNGKILAQGDAAGISDETKIAISSRDEAEFLLFNLG